MKIKIFINGIGSISSQESNILFNVKPVILSKNIIPAITPDFKEYIPAMQLRRMSKGIKMGLTAAKIALKDAEVTLPDAILTGTGQGAKVDTERFLREMLDRKEEMLSPTSFIQSTHNTVGGQIALNLKCNGYNMTYSHNSASLESALIDATLFLQEDAEKESVLVGGVDELSDVITSFQKLDGQIKAEDNLKSGLFTTGTPGTIISEGAHFFTLSREKTLASYARLVGIKVFNAEEPGNVKANVEDFLKVIGINAENIDILITGNNGDIRYDHFYDRLKDELFPGTTQIAYKHLVGDYDTVSGYAIAIACRILKEQNIPKILFLKGNLEEKPGKVLIYNNYLGENHSLILLEKIEL